MKIHKILEKTYFNLVLTYLKLTHTNECIKVNHRVKIIAVSNRIKVSVQTLVSYQKI